VLNFVEFESDGQSIGNLSNPQGLFVDENDSLIYICDTGNNRIIVVKYIEETSSYELVRVVNHIYIDPADVPTAVNAPVAAPPASGDDDDDEINDGGIEDVDVPLAAAEFDTTESLYNEDGLIQSTFSAPHDIFISRRGEIFIADTNNQRILRLDKDFNYINSIFKPEAIEETRLEFLPCKLAVDFSNRVFAQVRNVNKGFMEFTVEGDFIGYMGASRVQVSLYDYFWKMIATDAMRSQMELFVPTEYNNIALDDSGFVYATLSTFAEFQIEDADPVRRLNAVGSDILVRNGYWVPVGDWWWSNLGGAWGPSRFSDVVPLANDAYACLDRNRGRIFAYDFQGNLLYAFGGRGNMEGRFLDAVAIDRMGADLFVLDARAGTVTRFNLTEYGLLINQAMQYYYNGLYDESAEKWDQVLKLNGNYDLAYIGKGRAALRNEEFLTAMRYYEYKLDQENYGKAFQLYRKQWIEENITTIIIVVISLFVISKALKITLKILKKRRGGA
jgi:DNA-binding beta-propeller fold protein YncE